MAPQNTYKPKVRIFSLNRLCLLFAVSLIIAIGTACKRENSPESIQTNTYLRVFPSETNQTCFSINPTKDNGFLLFSSSDLLSTNDALALNITKLNSAGNIEWTTKYTDSIYRPRVTGLSDGSFIISSSFYTAEILKIDPNGQLVFKSRYTRKQTVSTHFSDPIQGSDGNFYVADSDIAGSDDSSLNFVRKYSKEGKYLQAQPIYDSLFGGKTAYLSIHGFEAPGTYYLTGLVWLYPWSYLDNAKLFVSKVSFSNNVLTSKKTTILLPQTISNSNPLFYKFNIYYKTLFTSEKDLIICTHQNGLAGNTGHLFCVDDNLNKKWEIDLRVGVKGTIPVSIAQCPDGNYLIVGFCWVDVKYLEQPFACKISKDGKIIWTKIFSMALNSTFDSGFQTLDGSYIFGGTTNSFGNAANQNDIFIMKTDREGNLK